MKNKTDSIIFAGLWGVLATMMFFFALSLPSAFPAIAELIVSVWPYICVWFVLSLLILVTFFRK